MAKRAKPEQPDGHGVSAFRGNGFDPAIMQSLTDRILNLHGDLDRIASERMAESKEVRKDMDEVYTEAKNAGIPKKAFKAKIKKILLEQKVEALREDLEGDEQDAFDQIEQALGDLGKAAADSYRARKSANGAEAHA